MGRVMSVIFACHVGTCCVKVVHVILQTIAPCFPLPRKLPRLLTMMLIQQQPAPLQTPTSCQWSKSRHWDQMIAVRCVRCAVRGADQMLGRCSHAAPIPIKLKPLAQFNCTARTFFLIVQSCLYRSS